MTLVDEEDVTGIIRLGSGYGLGYSKRKELQKKTDIYVTPYNSLAFDLRENLGNAVDKKNITKIRVKIEPETPQSFNAISVADNGTKKLTREDIEKNLDFDHNASSKRGIHRVQTGAHAVVHISRMKAREAYETNPLLLDYLMLHELRHFRLFLDGEDVNIADVELRKHVAELKASVSAGTCAPTLLPRTSKEASTRGGSKSHDRG
jgi:hypothetical protein